MSTAPILLPTVLITGCSPSSIGHSLALSLQKRNYHVFATLRDPSKLEPPAAAAGGPSPLSTLPNVEILRLDVTDQAQLAACKEHVTARTGGKLDILINNAGVEFQSPLTDVDVDAARRLYDVDVWGVLAVVQAFAPLVVRAEGVVVNMSSIDAVLSMAWAGIFASSKAAVARLSETLKVELAPLGVRVVTVMTGSADTPMFTKPGGRMDLPEMSWYYGVQEAAFKERMDHRKGAMKVEVLAEKLVDEIVGGASGPIWYGHLAWLVRCLTWAAPTWVVDRMVNSERGVALAKVLV